MSIYFRVESWSVSNGWHGMYDCQTGASAKRKLLMLIKDFNILKKNLRIVKVVEEVMKF